MHIRPLLALLGLTLAAPAQAGVIVGGSALLTPTWVTQLETWLGGGSLVLTNIFTKQSGNTAANFHAAVDGMGPTISVMRATSGAVTATIGGYNPFSWNSTGSYNQTTSGAAFIFNLDTLTKKDQTLNFQTFNGSVYGPTFGGGHDIYVSDNLTFGYSQAHSYGAPNNTSILSGLPNLTFLTVAGMEIFAVSYNTQTTPPPTSTPEPNAVLLLGGALAALGAGRRLVGRAAG